MADLISRAAATRAAVISVRNYLGNIDSERDIHIEEGLYEVPAVDAVPVVRCRDCKYGEPDTNGLGDDMVMCQNKQNPIGFGDWLMPPEFFCADGEPMPKCEVTQ